MEAEGLPEGEELAMLEAFRDQLPPEILTEPAVHAAGQPGRTQLDRGNDAQGVALLDEAGWTVGADGIRRNATGETLTVEIHRRQPDLRAGHQPLVENLRADRHRRKLDAWSTPRRWRSGRGSTTTTSCRARLSRSASALDRAAAVLRRDRRSATGQLQPARACRPGGGRADRAGHRRQDPGGADAACQGAGPGAAAEADLGAATGTSGKYLVAYYDMFGHPPSMPPYARGDATSGGSTSAKLRRV